MGLRRRLICKILIEDGVAVKYRNFTDKKRIAGNPASVIRTLSDQILDEFMICDVGVIRPELVREMMEPVFTPVSAAGSIHTMAQVDELIRSCGVDKVVIKDADLAENVALKYGRQAVIFPVTYGGDAAFFGVPDCAGEVLLTSVDRDGTGAGYDLAALRFDWQVPVVLAGGCGKLTHVKEAFEAGANGVAISSMFFFSDKSPIKLRSWLVSEGCQVRAA